jgi:7,8-dihydroneopterin aldolase/epimerase/oxygenase
MPDELDEVTLAGMTFHTIVGVLPHEREHPQPLRVDVTAWVHRGHGVLDYRRIYAVVRSAMDAQSHYLEEIADGIAAKVLLEGSVRRVRVAIRKPHAAVGGPIEHAEVAITRSQDA